MRKLFGTDGIRGVANKHPLTVEICNKLAKALTVGMAEEKKKCSIIIGKDTRISGDIFEHALAAAFASFGIDSKLVGVCPTPAISILTKSLGADLGIMISASHNIFSDNGIKIFNKDGLKLTDIEEEKIEKLMDEAPCEHEEIIEEKVGRVYYFPQALELYIDKVKKTFSFDESACKKLKIVVDSSNGSFSNIAPKILQDFGFNVVSICGSPNGININAECGVTTPSTIAAATVANNADIGIAFDGDGDRLLLCDGSGNFLDGDHILAILVESYKLENSEIVSTIMSNFGLEQYLRSKNIKLVRTQVGDRYISEYMRQSAEAQFGGEPSGHVIIREHAPTGDGFFAALKVLEYVVKSGKKLNELLNLFTPYPVVSCNVKVCDKNVVYSQCVAQKIDEYRRKLVNRGKLIVRPSGTEPLIRISAEGEDKSELDAIVNDIVDIIKSVQ